MTGPERPAAGSEAGSPPDRDGAIDATTDHGAVGAFDVDELFRGWPEASGSPLASGRIRVSPEDFRVVELNDVVPAGAGEHVLLRVRKTDWNTAAVARGLARLADVPSRDVGYAGRKDRRAVTEQWFSVRLAGRRSPDWSALAMNGVEVLEAVRHDRKLRTGALAGNRFDIIVRSFCGDAGEIGARIEALRAYGVPNYFGPQRFGRGASNLRAASRWFTGGRAPRSRDARSLALSAARSRLFNDVLAERVARGRWRTRLPGDVFGLDGSRGVFADDGSDALDARLAAGDIHPTGPLPGTGTSAVASEALALEAAVLAGNADWLHGLEQAGIRADRRPLRVNLKDLTYETGTDWLRLAFSLPPGAYATGVLRELVSL